MLYPVPGTHTSDGGTPSRWVFLTPAPAYESRSSSEVVQKHDEEFTNHLFPLCGVYLVLLTDNCKPIRPVGSDPAGTLTPWVRRVVNTAPPAPPQACPAMSMRFNFESTLTLAWSSFQLEQYIGPPDILISSHEQQTSTPSNLAIGWKGAHSAPGPPAGSYSDVQNEASEV